MGTASIIIIAARVTVAAAAALVLIVTGATVTVLIILIPGIAAAARAPTVLIFTRLIFFRRFLGCTGGGLRLRGRVLPRRGGHNPHINLAALVETAPSQRESLKLNALPSL